MAANHLQQRPVEEPLSMEIETPMLDEQELRQPETARRRRLGEEELPETPSAQTDASTVEIEAETLMAGLRAEQRLGLAVLGGLAAAVVGAAVWATVTVVAGVQIGWMAIGIGCLVGGAVRLIGKGITKPFGYVGAGLSLVGCLLGNLLSLCAIVGQQEGMSLSLVLLNLNPAAIPGAMIATFHPMDIMFYALAIGAGYQFSFRRVTSADAARIAAAALMI